MICPGCGTDHLTCSQCGALLPSPEYTPEPIDRPPGRPSKLTDNLIGAICDMIRTGVTYSVAVQANGISSNTAARWMQSTNYPYSEFRRRVEIARAEAEAERIRRINVAGVNGTWQADAWWLERFNPKDWGRKDRIEMTGEGGGPIQVEQLQATVYQIAVLAKQYVPENRWADFRTSVMAYIENVELERAQEEDELEGEVVNP